MLKYGHVKGPMEFWYLMKGERKWSTVCLNLKKVLKNEDLKMRILNWGRGGWHSPIYRVWSILAQNRVKNSTIWIDIGYCYYTLKSNQGSLAYINIGNLKPYWDVYPCETVEACIGIRSENIFIAKHILVVTVPAYPYPIQQAARSSLKVPSVNHAQVTVTRFVIRHILLCLLCDH